MTDSNPTVQFQMGRKGFCGCCSLQQGAVFTGILASVYNGALIYWFVTTMNKLESNDELYTVLQVTLAVLMFLAAVHIIISLMLIYGVIKGRSELVMLWVVVYIASCCVVSSLFTIGFAFMHSKVFLYIIFCNLLFTFNIVMTFQLYKLMVADIKKKELLSTESRA